MLRLRAREAAHLPPESGDPGPASSRQQQVSRLRSSRLEQRFGLVAVLVAAAVIFSILRPATFATEGNLVSVLASTQVTLVLALGVILTLRIGDLDLSFGACMVLSSVVAADLQVDQHLPLSVVILVALLVGVAAGIVNGVLIVFFGLNSFVVTLGMMSVLEGIAYGISHTQVITGVSPALVNAVNHKVAGLPLGVIYGLVLAAIIWYALEFTPLGRLLSFIGGSAEAAALLGLPVRRIRIAAYVASGLIYSAAGVLLVGSVSAADPSVAAQYLLPPLAGAFLSTTAIQAGRFNVIGTVIGLYLLATISTGIQFLGAPTWLGEVFNGAALVVAIGLARRRSRARSAS